MENDTIRNIFKKEIEFKFKLEDLFAIQFDYDDYSDSGYTYIEELKEQIKKETLATISDHIFNELKSDIKEIKEIIHDEVRKYRKNGEIIIKDEAEKTLTFNLNNLKNEISKEMKEKLIEEVREDWSIQRKGKELKNEILKSLGFEEE